MSDYKHYFLRQLGIKESQFKSTGVEDPYPDIDKDELEKGTGEEEKEHGLPPEQAAKTAVDHLKEPQQSHYYTGVEKAKEKGELNGNGVQSMSPTAIQTPVIGLAVRGSTTGGFPSGKDQTGIEPSTPTGRLGGYEPIPIAKDNSQLVDKTPKNSSINSSSPISDSSPTQVDGHPHQIQNAAGEVPQSVTGAETDGNTGLTPKPSNPEDVEIDITETNNNMNETFAKHLKLTLDKLALNEGKHKAGCECGFCKNKGTFGKKSKDKDDEKGGDKEHEKEEKGEKKEKKNDKKKKGNPFAKKSVKEGIRDKSNDNKPSLDDLTSIPGDEFDPGGINVPPSDMGGDLKFHSPPGIDDYTGLPIDEVDAAAAAADRIGMGRMGMGRMGMGDEDPAIDDEMSNFPGGEPYPDDIFNGPEEKEPMEPFDPHGPPSPLPPRMGRKSRDLNEIIKSLKEKAIAGKMNKKETTLFRLIKEVIAKRSSK